MYRHSPTLAMPASHFPTLRCSCPSKLSSSKNNFITDLQLQLQASLHGGNASFAPASRPPDRLDEPVVDELVRNGLRPGEEAEEEREVLRIHTRHLRGHELAAGGEVVALLGLRYRHQIGAEPQSPHPFQSL